MSASYASSLDLTLMIDCPPGADGAPPFATPMQFVSSADGAADGSTIVASALGASVTADDDLVGYMVECIDATNTANIGHRQMVTEQDEATEIVTLTCDQFPAQTKSGDTFRLINCIPAAPYFVEDTGGSSAQVQDASRNAESDDHWLGSAQEGGPYLEPVEADNVAKTSLRLVTDFTQSGGVAAATLGANTAIGDMFEANCCPEWHEHGFITCDYGNLPREQYQGTAETPGDAKGPKTAVGQGTLLFRGPGTGRAGEKTEAYRIFSSPFDVVDGGDLTVNGEGTTTSIPYDAGTAVVGRMYCTAEGDVFMCTSAGTPCVPSPALRVACADNSTVVGLKTFIRPTDFLLNHHLYAKQYRGNGIIERIFGLVPTITVSAALNDFLRFNVGFQGSDWERTYKDSAGAHVRAWRAKRPTVNPVKVAGGRVVVGGTTMSFKSCSIDYKLRYTAMEADGAPNHMSGYRWAGCDPAGQLVAIVDDTNIELVEHELSGVDIATLLIQVGSRTGFPGVFGFYAYKAQIRKLAFSKDGDKHVVTADFKVNDHDTDTSGLPAHATGIG